MDRLDAAIRRPQPDRLVDLNRHCPKLKRIGFNGKAAGKQVLPATFGAGIHGKFNKVPVIEGSNQHRHSLLSAYVADAALGREINAAEYQAAVTSQFGAALAPTLLSLYPVTITPAWSYDSMLTDAGFACNGRKVAKLIAAQGVPVYTYELTDEAARKGTHGVPFSFRTRTAPGPYGHAPDFPWHRAATDWRMESKFL